MVGVGENPTKLAAGWATGVAISLSPLVGLQTILALASALVFRLKKVDVVLASMVINPWTFPLYFPFAVLIGHGLTGIKLEYPSVPDPARAFHVAMWRGQMIWLRPMLLSWLVGATLCAVVVGLALFFLLRKLIEHHRETLTDTAIR